jgi:hypothetical protein
MRYDYAARELERAETGEEVEPESYLVVAVRQIRTSDTGAAGPPALADVPAGPSIRLERRPVCHREDPCHVSYGVSWDTAGVAGEGLVAPTGPVVRVTTYEVTLTLGNHRRKYEAQVRYHAPAEDGGVMMEVVDPVIPGLQQLVDDRAPLAQPHWARHALNPLGWARWL